MPDRRHIDLQNLDLQNLDLQNLDLQNLDARSLTPELWGAIKSRAVRRAREERSQAMREFFRLPAFWRRPAAGGRRGPSPRAFNASRA
jgi:hypothetical protein